LIYAKEEPELELSPAMDAVLRVFKRVNAVSDTGADQSSSTLATCSVRLLVAASQAINLIGKQGASIKSIQENTGATIRIIARGTYIQHPLGKYIFVQLAYNFIKHFTHFFRLSWAFVVLVVSHVRPDV